MRVCADVLLAARAGSLDRARALLASAPPPRGLVRSTLLDLVRLAIGMLDEDPEMAALARKVCEQVEPRRYARVAGMAAVALARAGRSAPPAPDWLTADSPLRVFWEWAAGIARGDASLLGDVAARFEAMECPYEAALAAWWTEQGRHTADQRSPTPTVHEAPAKRLREQRRTKEDQPQLVKPGPKLIPGGPGHLAYGRTP